MIDLTPDILDNSDVDPSSRCAELVDSSSVETPESYQWSGANDGEEYILEEGTDCSFGQEEAGPAASDETLVASVPVMDQVPLGKKLTS